MVLPYSHSHIKAGLLCRDGGDSYNAKEDVKKKATAISVKIAHHKECEYYGAHVAYQQPGSKQRRQTIT